MNNIFVVTYQPMFKVQIGFNYGEVQVVSVNQTTDKSLSSIFDHVKTLIKNEDVSSDCWISSEDYDTHITEVSLCDKKGELVGVYKITRMSNIN